MFISDCPNVLIVHLQRIIFDLDYLMNVKVNSRYEFPFNLNLKKYSVQHYEEERIASLPEDQRPKKTEEKSEADYEYTQAGVVCHYGSAEIGHYYSYININRNDPLRPHIDKDKWLEFNDSRITDFDLKNFEESCFGSGTGNDKDDDFEMQNNKYEKLTSNRSAYILVYEKKNKGMLSFSFDDDNIKEKGDIQNNQIKTENLNPESENFDLNNNKLEVGYYDLKPFHPAKLLNEITNDNFKFQMEQQIYSKEFLNFVTDIITLEEFKDLDFKKVPDTFEAGNFSEEEVNFYRTQLKICIQMYTTIMSHSSENSCIAKFTDSMIKIMTICPQLAFDFLRENFYEKFFQTLVLLMNCSDSVVRKATSKLQAYTVIITIKYEDIDLQEYSVMEIDDNSINNDIGLSQTKLHDKLREGSLQFFKNFQKMIFINQKIEFYKS